jgi:hypothetical protein
MPLQHLAYVDAVWLADIYKIDFLAFKLLPLTTMSEVKTV